MTPQILKYKGIEDWTGGVQGIAIIKPQAPLASAAQPRSSGSTSVRARGGDRDVRRRRASRSRAPRPCPDRNSRQSDGGGRRWASIRALYKTLTFGVSALFTGVGGALSAIAVQFVAPDSFGFLLSISFLVGIVIGGFASISGAIYGAFFIEFIPNIADSISKSAPWAVYGAFLVASVYLMPSGVAGRHLHIAHTPYFRRPKWVADTYLRNKAIETRYIN